MTPLPGTSQTLALDGNWQKIVFNSTGHGSAKIYAKSSNSSDVLVAIVKAGQAAPAAGDISTTYSIPAGSTGDLESEGSYRNDVYVRMLSGVGTARAEAWA
ncbi:hypothetical protein EON81_17680 [bacterium]|nr:MAG: hypothetical protein EON81_17680 [bacterium]